MNKAALIIIFLLFLGLLVTVLQIQNPAQKTQTKTRASSATGTATLTFNPSSKAIYYPETLPLDLKFYTPQTPLSKGITGIKAVFTFDNTALDLASGDITSSLSDSWVYVFKTVSQNGNLSTVNIEAIWSASGDLGYTASMLQPQTLATLNFHSKNSALPSKLSNLTFDIQRSQILAKYDNSDILAQNQTNGQITVYLDTTAPETVITSGPNSPLRTPSATFVFTGSDNPPSPTPTPVPPGTPTAELLYSYRLDQSAWSAYSLQTSITLNNFSVGSHTFEVRSKDRAGNVDPTPASFPFDYQPQTTLDVKIKFQGLTSASQNYPKTLKLKIRKSDYDSGYLSQTATYNSSDNTYSASYVLPVNFPSGSNVYQVLLKGPSHLQKLFSNISLTKDSANAIQKTSSGDELIRGDVTDDNIIKIDDVTGIISVWTQSSTPATDANRKFDLDENQFISLNDITALISNWTSSEVYGDQ